MGSTEEPSSRNSCRSVFRVTTAANRGNGVGRCGDTTRFRPRPCLQKSTLRPRSDDDDAGRLAHTVRAGPSSLVEHAQLRRQSMQPGYSERGWLCTPRDDSSMELVRLGGQFPSLPAGCGLAAVTEQVASPHARPACRCHRCFRFTWPAMLSRLVTPWAREQGAGLGP